MGVFGSIRKLRKVFTGVALGVWLFALFVGIAHACGWVEPGMSPVHAAAASTSGHSSDEGAPVGCEQFCKADVPVVTKVPPQGDQPDTQPLIVAVNNVRAVLASSPAFRLAQAAHSSADVPPFLRVTRLRL
jgi:hypothetical protein